MAGHGKLEFAVMSLSGTSHGNFAGIVGNTEIKNGACRQFLFYVTLGMLTPPFVQNMVVPRNSHELDIYFLHVAVA